MHVQVHTHAHTHTHSHTQRDMKKWESVCSENLRLFQTQGKWEKVQGTKPHSKLMGGRDGGRGFIRKDQNIWVREIISQSTSFCRTIMTWGQSKEHSEEEVMATWLSGDIITSYPSGTVNLSQRIIGNTPGLWTHLWSDKVNFSIHHSIENAYGTLRYLSGKSWDKHRKWALAKVIWDGSVQQVMITWKWGVTPQL